MENLVKKNLAAEFAAFLRKNKRASQNLSVRKDGAIYPLKLARAWTAHVASL